MCFHTLKTANNYPPAIILDFFNVEITTNNMCVCPFHNDTQESMQVNEDFVFCHGCGFTGNTTTLLYHILSKKTERTVQLDEVLIWFDVHHSKFSKQKRSYYKSTYLGAVPKNIIEYWHSCMEEDQYRYLEDRLITRETADKYLLGYRPENKVRGIVIPFWRGYPGESEIDIVQFRLFNGKSKYVGLKGYNRGSIMNAYILKEPRPYIVVFFGTFDAILGLQDGLWAVGTTGATAFRKEDRPRIKEMFSNQNKIYIVPDNQNTERLAANEMAKWLGAEVRFFDPTKWPEKTDYTDYRKAGRTYLDFLDEVL